MPHEGSDVLNLPATGAMAPYFTCEFDGRQKLIRQLHGLKLAERQGDQLFAQALQGPVFIFFPRSAFIIRIHFAGLTLDASDRSLLDFYNDRVDFAPKLMQYLPWCGNGRVHSGA